MTNEYLNLPSSDIFMLNSIDGFYWFCYVIL